MTRGAPVWVATALALLAAVGSVPAAAQTTCGDGGGVAVRLLGAAVEYDIAGGTSGTELGLEGDARVGASRVRLAAATVLLERGRTDPLLARAEILVPLVSVLGIRLCGGALAGASRLSAGADRSTAVVGGLGATIARSVPLGPLRLSAFLQVRGLAGAVTGEALDSPLEAQGLAVGGTGGLWLEIGRVGLRAEGSLDGFDPGLGPTPFPVRAIRVAAGLRF